jgi:hypothetical protein
MANDTPHDGARALSIEQLAIRRVRDSLREADSALAELDALLSGVPAISRESIIRGACYVLGELGDVSHEVRRELLKIFGLYPF